MDTMVYNWIENALFALYPPTCVLCGGQGAADHDLCHGCAADLPRNANPCRRCAEPLPAGTPAGTLCGRCLRSPPAFDVCRAPYLYAPPADWLIGQLKFRAHLAHGRVLGALLADHLAGLDGPLPDLIVPMPLHRSRLRERGFNQAIELARPVGRRLGIPLAADLVERVRPGQAQSSLHKSRRQQNVRGAFALRRPLDAWHVAIVDDVLTTGASAGELAATLRRAGAERVEVWVVARTPP
jgi:ComF family protein